MTNVILWLPANLVYRELCEFHRLMALCNDLLHVGRKGAASQDGKEQNQDPSRNTLTSRQNLRKREAILMKMRKKQGLDPMK